MSTLKRKFGNYVSASGKLDNDQDLISVKAMLIIMTEKLFLRLPRVAGKIERFYTNIVEGESFL